MRVVECLAIVGIATILRIIVIIVAALIRRINAHFAHRCPKCKTAHKVFDKYCRMCGYELGGYIGWIKREEKENE